MDNENEYQGVEEETLPEEETTQEEEQQPKEEVVTLPKDKFKSIQRKAIAYDAEKKNKLSVKEEIGDDVVQAVRKLEMMEEKRQFGYDHQLSPEETDFIFKFANGKPSKETLENPFIKSGIEGFRASKRVEANIPSSSSRSSIFQGKDFKEMTNDERKSAFENASKKFIR